LVTGFISLFAQSIPAPGIEGSTSATRSTSNESRATQDPYSEPDVSTGVVRSTRLRAGERSSIAACMATSVPPMHQPRSESSSWPDARSVSRMPHASSSHTKESMPMSASSSPGTPQSMRKTSKPSSSRYST
jgi:hypothetical protein